MKFYSTKNKNSLTDLKQAVLAGMPPDKGLFMPTFIPRITKPFFNDLSKMNFPEISLQIANKFLAEDISKIELEKIIKKSITFDAPVKEISKDLYSLELFHGPTLAFKDFGARFMARFMEYILKDEDSELFIVVATSGDTGSAVANGFFGIEGIKVVILYPSGKVSKLQEKQLTTFNKNIYAVELKGNFDDCQKLAKKILTDNKLEIKVSSANSINFARLLPQIFYYFWAVIQLKRITDKEIVISVPSGNFGNITAATFAKKMGLGLKTLIAATNINDSVPKYLNSGIFTPISTKHTISNAMDVGNPSNFIRLVELYNNSLKNIKKDIFGFSFSDKQTKENILSLYRKTGHILEPHSSVASLGINKITDKNLCKVFVETAHPSKFSELVESIIGVKPYMPKRLSNLIKRKKNATKLDNNYYHLKDFIYNLK